MLTEQINPQFVHGDNVMPLVRALHQEDLQELDCHQDPNLLLFRCQKVEDQSKVSHCEAKWLREVPVHGGSQKTDAPRKLAHRRKRKFGKGREYSLVDRTAFHIWSFGRGDFLSAGKLSAASIFGHHRVCQSVLPKRAYRIVVDGIESHPFHPQIEDDWLLVHQATNHKRPSLTSFFPKKGTGKRL
jgi:hypothetical protein